MKKIANMLLALALLTSGVLLQSSSVQAACGGWWYIGEVGAGGEMVSFCDSKSQDETFASSVDLDNDEYGKYVLNVTLNNYNGGEFKIEGLSAGLEVVKVIITLVGKNTVPQKTIMPGTYWGAPVEIKGEGTLTFSDVAVVADTTEASVGESEKEDGSAGMLMLVSIVAGVYVVISVVVFVILGLKIKNLKTKK